MHVPNKNFVYGMGSFFNLLNSEHRKCFKNAQENGFFFHSSISYPGSSLFFKSLNDKKLENHKRLILKIAGYSYDQLRFEIDESFKEFDISELYAFQIWEKLPYKNGSINFAELNKIIYYIEDLKKQNIINKIFFQLEPNLFEINEIDFFDGYAFYGYPNEVQLEKKHYDYILKKDKYFMQFQFFGGRQSKIFRENFKKKIDKSNHINIDNLWIDECINFNNNNFGKKTFFVGCTQKSRRLKYLAKKLKEPYVDIKKDYKINFSDNLQYQTKVNYPVGGHPAFLKKIRKNSYLFKLYIKKVFKL